MTGEATFIHLYAPKPVITIGGESVNMHEICSMTIDLKGNIVSCTTFDSKFVYKTIKIEDKTQWGSEFPFNERDYE